jgi:Mlc titration factor MtfA (ptsG expression regulator)
MALYRELAAADRRELEGHVQVFIAEKYFEGCGGLKITESMKVLVAAQACVLLLHRESDYFPGMRSVLVYPGPFVGAGKASGPGGMVTESLGWRTGESWHTPASGGPVVLSWPDVLAGAADAHDGRNVVYHEFAHQLDGESGWVEGSPAFERVEDAAEWKRVMSEQFQAHARAVWSGMPTVIGAYGATSPAEFFAVATEQFFEQGPALKAANPEVYRLLAGYYRQDPAAACGLNSRVGAA